MPATTTYSPTGTNTTDALLTGKKWAVGSLTFSFPSDATLYGSTYTSGEQNNAFEAFTTQQQNAVRTILSGYASVINMTFTEVTETSTTHGDLRYAESDSPATAWGYGPSTSDAGGDMWFNNNKNYYDNPITGNYAWLTMMHETGHALGLKHPHEATTNFAALSTAYDSMEYSVMSYRSYLGASTTGGYTNTAPSYAQSLMMLDIQALQTLYGANFTTNSGDTTYKFDTANGQMSINGVNQGALAGNKIFRTIWDGGGRDTYDFSNYTTNLKVDLAPGAWSTLSTTQLADLNGFAPGTKLAAGNIANALQFQGDSRSLIESAKGGAGADLFRGNVADNEFTGNAGNDTLYGGAGADTAAYAGRASDYAWSQQTDGSWQVRDLRVGGLDGVDTLFEMEYLRFSDLVTSITAPPPVNTNAAPVITSGAQTGSAVEWADLSADEVANTTHRAGGWITYSDANAGDVHTAALAARGTGYIGSLTLDTSAIDTTRSIGWNFAVSDSAMDYLAAGQSLTQTWDVTIGDGHGGSAVQSIVVTLTGAADGTTTTTPKKGKGGAGAGSSPANGQEVDEIPLAVSFGDSGSGAFPGATGAYPNQNAWDGFFQQTGTGHALGVYDLEPTARWF